MILFIIAAAGVFSYMLSSLFITQSIAEWIGTLDVNRWVLMGFVNVFLLIAGFFLPPVAVILMAAPILLPIITTAGFDPIWFAVVLTINMEIGLITPPVGLNLYVINGIAPRYFAENHPERVPALCGLYGIGDRAVVPVPRSGHVVAGCDDGGIVVSFFSDLVSTVFERRYRAVLPDEEDSRTIEELCTDLLGRHGEVSGAILARNILDRYAQMSTDEKCRFFEFMTRELDIDAEAVQITLKAYGDAPSKQSYRAFAQASEPQRQELTRRLNQVPGATGQLVAMRKDLLDLIPDHPGLEPLDVDLETSVFLVVQSRVSGAAPDHMGQPGGYSGEDHRLRGGTRDRQLGRVAPPGGAERPAMLWVFPSRDGG